MKKITRLTGVGMTIDFFLYFKAFHKVCHDLLLRKLSVLGIKNRSDRKALEVF